MLLLRISGVSEGVQKKGSTRSWQRAVQQQGFISCTATYQVKHLQVLFPSRRNSEY